MKEVSIALNIKESFEYGQDNRTRIEQLYKAYDRLTDSDVFDKELVHIQRVQLDNGVNLELPIFSFKTLSQTKVRKSVLILSGVHGEEPTGPIALAESIEALVSLARSGTEVVVLPLLNPIGYFRNWRYQNMAEYSDASVGQSVSDAEHLLLNDTQTAARASKESSETAKQVTEYILRLISEYQFSLSIDLHEDQLLTEGAYIYSQGLSSEGDQIASAIISDIQELGMPVHPDGKTRFEGEVIRGGIVRNEYDNIIKDGSIDELIATDQIFMGESVQSKSAVPCVFVTELPTKGKWGNLQFRVSVYKKVVEQLPKYLDLIT